VWSSSSHRIRACWVFSGCGPYIPRTDSDRLSKYTPRDSASVASSGRATNREPSPVCNCAVGSPVIIPSQVLITGQM
jgi:hypothetical protein